MPHSKQYVKKGNHTPPFVTNPINTPRNPWHVRNETMNGAYIWNKLPSTLKSIQIREMFKQALQEHLLKSE